VTTIICPLIVSLELLDDRRFVSTDTRRRSVCGGPCHDLIEIDGLEAIEHSSRRSHWRTFVVEGDRLDAAIRLAARIPTARLGGAIEIRPVAKYW